MNAPTNQRLIHLPPGHVEITEFNATAAALDLLRAKNRDLPDLSTHEGMRTARAVQAEIKTYRIRLRETRNALKEPLAARIDLIVSEAKRIDGELEAIGQPIQTAIKAEERRQAIDKEAKKQAEAERRAAIEAHVNDIRARVTAVASLNAAAIREALEYAWALELDPDEFAESWPEAMKATAEARRSLEALLMQREALEARQAEEEARLQARREELARQKAALEQQRAEETAQRYAEQAELAQLRAAEQARQAVAEPMAHVQPPDSDAETAKADPPTQNPTETPPKAAPIKGRRATKPDPLMALKNAFTAGTLPALEAIDRAYHIGFKAGEQTTRKAA